MPRRATARTVSTSPSWKRSPPAAVEQGADELGQVELLGYVQSGRSQLGGPARVAAPPGQQRQPQQRVRPRVLDPVGGGTIEHPLQLDFGFLQPALAQVAESGHEAGLGSQRGAADRLLELQRTLKLAVVQVRADYEGIAVSLRERGCEQRLVAGGLCVRQRLLRFRERDGLISGGQRDVGEGHVDVSGAAQVVLRLGECLAQQGRAHCEVVFA